MLKEKQIHVFLKKPGAGAVEEPLFDNTLESFQAAVGGYIETVTICTDLIIVCNEEGRLLDLPYNTTIAGYDFYGPIVITGAHRDEFCSIKPQNLPFVRKWMKSL